MFVFDSISGSFGFSLLFLFVTQLPILPTFVCVVQVTVDYSDDVAITSWQGFVYIWLAIIPTSVRLTCVNCIKCDLKAVRSAPRLHSEEHY